jgi:hypothetical protein
MSNLEKEIEYLSSKIKKVKLLNGYITGQVEGTTDEYYVNLTNNEHGVLRTTKTKFSSRGYFKIWVGPTNINLFDFSNLEDGYETRQLVITPGNFEVTAKIYLETESGYTIKNEKEKYEDDLILLKNDLRNAENRFSNDILSSENFPIIDEINNFSLKNNFHLKIEKTEEKLIKILSNFSSFKEKYQEELFKFYREKISKILNEKEMENK